MEWATIHKAELLEDWHLARRNSALKKIAPSNRRILLLKDIIAVKPLGGYRIWIRFEDGIEGEVDLGAHLSFTGVFEPLKDAAYFAKVRVDPDLGTICWPNDADIDPVVLYALVTHQPIPDYLSDRPKVQG